MAESEQPPEEIEILRQLSSVVSVINEYCQYSQELKPNVLFYLLKLELLNDNAFTQFNEIEVIWKKNEDVYGKNHLGQESIVFKNRNTFPSELCGDQITGASTADIKEVDGEIAEEIISDSLQGHDEVIDPSSSATAVCKIEENAEVHQDTATEVVAPVFVQQDGYGDISQVAEQIQEANELQFTLSVQDGETYEYIQTEPGMVDSFEVETAAGNIFSSRSQAIQSLNITSLAAGTKLMNVEGEAHATDDSQAESVDSDLQDKLTNSKQIVVNDRSLVPTYECPECGKKFSVAHKLKSHIMTHYKVKTEVCTICNKSFTGKSLLARHMKLTHGVGLEKTYPCKVCKKEFPTVPRLVQHLRIHTGEASHACDLCPARFPTATSLQWHRKVHESSSQHPCEACGWVYKTKGVLQNHVRKFHPELCEDDPKPIPRQTFPRQRSSQKQEPVDEVADKKKFDKLLTKLRQKNLIKEQVGKKNVTPETTGKTEDEDSSGKGESTDDHNGTGSGVQVLSEGDIKVELMESPATEKEENSEGIEPVGEDSGMVITSVEATRKSSRKRKVKALYEEDEIESGSQEDVSETPTKEVTSDSTSKTRVKKETRRCECGHGAALWDTHSYCLMCRLKGRGPDACVVGGEEALEEEGSEVTCSVCEGFTQEQQQYLSIRKRAFLKAREISKNKASLKSKKKSKLEVESPESEPKQEMPTDPDSQETDDPSLFSQETLISTISGTSIASEEIQEETGTVDILPKLAEAHLEVESYQKELEDKYRWYKCLYCEKSFLHKTSLVNHMNSVHEHTEEILFPCTECQKVFATLAQLKRHFTTHGIGGSLTPCPECGRTFRDKSNLTKHRLIHLDVKLFTCEFCGKAFSTCGGLTIHRRSHTGSRPYQCRYCEKCFTNMGALRGHERVHTGEKPFVCDMCGVCFRDRSHLNRHKKSHMKSDRVRPYRCGICGKTFTAQVNLTKHLRGHNVKTEHT